MNNLSNLLQREFDAYNDINCTSYNMYCKYVKGDDKWLSRYIREKDTLPSQEEMIKINQWYIEFCKNRIYEDDSDSDVPAIFKNSIKSQSKK